MTWAIVILGILLAAAVAAGLYLFSTREQEDPFITPRRHYSVERLQELVGTVGSFMV